LRLGDPDATGSPSRKRLAVIAERHPNRQTDNKNSNTI